ncbi:hypothetical protein AC249_AIPGENE5867 [Exaiptasia diaphana]|nr:hypothetical protein AC249_AIPGENE5867 [Exaiptasia diaphana]
MADSLTSYLYVLFVVSYFFRSLTSENIRRLVPEQLQPNEYLSHNESRIYWLTNLEHECDYELRISYPATIPTTFLLELTSPINYLPGHQGRKLLNIEKMIFKNSKSDQYAKVTAIRTGLPWNSAKLKDRVYFNIVLEKLYFGLPLEVWKTGVFILCTLIIVFTLILPKIQGFFENENLKSAKMI